MFLRAKTRIKDGNEHRYWSVVENRRVSGGKTIQRQVLYLGEMGASEQAQWNRALEAFDEGTGRMTQIALFPEGQAPEVPGEAVQVRLKEFELHRPRQWGACWLALDLWEQLQLDAFWQERLPPSRKKTSWLNVLKTLTCYRLIDPGSEWRLHRQWWDRSAMGDLLGEDAALAESHKLYRCLDKLVEHKAALFTHLTERWKTLFNPRFDVLLYDLTSTYFECDPPAEGKRKYGYSRDKRPDCVQVVIALIIAARYRTARYLSACDARGLSLGLRGACRKHQRQDHPWGFSGKDREAIRQGGPYLGDGSRHSHRRDAGQDARLLAGGELSRWYAEGTVDGA
jgi:hypothetical protein